MTSKHTEPDAALAEWRRINRPARRPRQPQQAQPADIVQFPLRLVANAAENAA